MWENSGIASYTRALAEGADPLHARERVFDHAVANLISSSISRSTAAYASGFRMWSNFCEGLNIPHEILAPSIDTCRQFVSLFNTPSTARQYVAHVMHHINASGSTQANPFKSEPVQQIFRGLKRRHLYFGKKPKPKPIFTASMVEYIVTHLPLAEIALSTIIVLGFSYGWRMMNEGFPIRWLFGPQHICIRRAPIPPPPNMDMPIPYTHVDLDTRKNLPQGSTQERGCICPPDVYNDTSEYAWKRAKPLCTVHAILKYQSIFPSMTEPGTSLFPPRMSEVNRKRVWLGSSRSLKVGTCTPGSFVKVLQRFVSQHIHMMPGFPPEHITHITTRILRRSMATALVVSGAPLHQVLAGGQWGVPRSILSYVAEGTIAERSIFQFLADSDDEAPMAPPELSERIPPKKKQRKAPSITLQPDEDPFPGISSGEESGSDTPPPPPNVVPKAAPKRAANPAKPAKRGRPKKLAAPKRSARPIPDGDSAT